MINLKIKDRDYQLKLTTKGCVNCEKRLGKNPINIFMEVAETNELPMLGDLMIILHECLIPFNHNISIDDVYKINDDYCAEGNNLKDLLQVMLEVFQDSGILPKEDEIKNV